MASVKMISVIAFLTFLPTVILAQCPPLGSTLPVPSNYKTYPVVQEVAGQIESVLRKKTAFKSTAIALTMGTTNDDAPLLTFHNTPTIYNSTGSHVLSTDTQFIIASVSKLFTAYGIKLLAESKKVHLDESVTTYVPELLELKDQARPKNSITVTDWRAITIEALLSQLADIAEDRQYRKRRRKSWLMLILAAVGDSDIDNAPGNYSAYGLPTLNKTDQGVHCGDAFNPYQRPCSEKGKEIPR